MDNDADYVRTWLVREGNDPNTRDYTGRTPLHLAVTSSTIEIVQLLIDHKARLVARLVDGKTALHLAAMRGDAQIVSALLRKSEANEEEEEQKVDARRAAREAEKAGKPLDDALKAVNISQKESPSPPKDEDSDVDMISEDEDDDIDATTENSIVNIKTPGAAADEKVLEDEEDDEPDVYDVNVLAWDVAVSPLHLAIVHGHVDVVKTLVQEFGADVLLPIKLLNEYDNSAKAAILTLVLALSLPLEQAKEMARTLIQLGASSAQADMNQKTALLFSVADCPEILPTLVEADETGVKRAINHLAISESFYRPQSESPLMMAIKIKDTTAALRCLAAGSKPSIDFVAHMKAHEGRSNAIMNDSKHNKQMFEKTVEQPVVSAVQCEVPDIAIALIEEHGVDVNTLTKAGWAVMHDQYSRRWNRGRSLLDEVRDHIKALKEWKPEGNQPDAPLPLQDDATYLADIEEGSYAFWSASKQLKGAKSQYKRDLKNHQEALKRARDETSIPEKQAGIAELLERYEQLEKKLLQRGAKTFEELQPDVEKPEDGNRNAHVRRPFRANKPEPFHVEFKFQRLAALSDEARDRYLKLFEATWKGELQIVKELTLLPWNNSDGEDQPPLKVAVQDQHGLSPFAIAVLHGQFELATAMMEIAKAQYVEPDEPERVRYMLDNGEDDDEPGCGDEDINIYSEIVDDQFTVENIGEVSTQVKSSTPALAMLKWGCPAADFIGGPLRSSPQRSSGFSYFGPRRQFTMAGKRTSTGSLKVCRTFRLTMSTS